MRAVALFTGTHVNKLDAKGRVSVPKSFRASLTSDDAGGIYVYRSLKFEALEACDGAFMERIAASLDDMDFLSDEQDDLAATILADAHQLPFDGEGRIVPPPHLRDHAGIGGRIAFVGRGRTFQLWAPETFEARRTEARRRALDRGAYLKLPSPSMKEGAS